MFYLIEVEDYVRVEPKLFGLPTIEAVKMQLNETYLDYSDKELGFVIGVVEIMDVEEGIIIPGDGAAYYKSRFKILSWKPELQELVFGVIESIENFGAIIDLGVTKGLVHISQTMDDYVNFSKSNALIGRSTKKTLKKNDEVLARIIAISFKQEEIKIGLTMRQPGLGKLEWIEEEKRKARSKSEKTTKESKKKGKK